MVCKRSARRFLARIQKYFCRQMQTVLATLSRKLIGINSLQVIVLPSEIFANRMQLRERCPASPYVACRTVFAITLCLFLAANSCDANAGERLSIESGRKPHPGHYVALNMSDDGAAAIRDVLRPGVEGVQKRYAWRDLEPRKNEYDFSEISADLKTLEIAERQLVVFVFDKSFKDERYTPEYLWQNYTLPIRSATSGKGFVAKRWDPYVVSRFTSLLAAIGERFDKHPRFEGIAIQESALGIVDSVLDREQYSPLAYRNALVMILGEARQAFPESQVFWYMNYLARGQPLLRSVLAAVEPYEIVVGGPDVLPDSAPLQKHVYPLMKEHQRLMLFISAQNNSFRHRHSRLDAATRYWTPQEIFEFARDELGAQYLFWNRVTVARPADSYDINDAYPVIASHSTFNDALPVLTPAAN